MNREQWLEALAAKVAERLEGAEGKPLPKVRVSVGFPVGVRVATKMRSGAIGQCFASGRSSDGSSHIFISPILTDSLIVAGVLVHELVHAIQDCKTGHGPLFKKVAEKCGLTGKMTQTVVSPEGAEWLSPFLAELGEYPSSSLDPTQQKKQGTRMLKAQCPECGYTIRLTQKWADTGLPLCPDEACEEEGVRLTLR